MRWSWLSVISPFSSHHWNVPYASAHNMTSPAESQQLNYSLCSLDILRLSPALCPSSRRHIKPRSWGLVLINIPIVLFAKLEIIVLVCWPTSSVQITFGLPQIPLAAGGGWGIRMLSDLCCALHAEWARLGAELQGDREELFFWTMCQLKVQSKVNTITRSLSAANMERKEFIYFSLTSLWQ